MLTTGFNLCQGWSREEIAELTAGPEHVSPSTLAYEGIQTCLSQDSLKRQHTVVMGASVRTSGEFIEGNEVNLATETLNQFCQSLSILRQIIDFSQKDILKGESTMRRQGVSPASGHKRFERGDA